MLEKPVSVMRFESPAARRAWLISRRQIEEDWPEVFNIHTGSQFPFFTEVELNSRALSYEHRGEADHQKARLRPKPADWRRFWSSLDRIGIWDWRAAYRNPESVTDGYGFTISLAKGGRMLESRGYMAYPDRGGWSEEETAEWFEFIGALRVLLGGLPVA